NGGTWRDGSCYVAPTKCGLNQMVSGCTCDNKVITEDSGVQWCVNTSTKNAHTSCTTGTVRGTWDMVNMVCTCPSYSGWTNGKCTCNSGYESDGNGGCAKIPEDSSEPSDPVVRECGMNAPVSNCECLKSSITVNGTEYCVTNTTYERYQNCTTGSVRGKWNVSGERCECSGTGITNNGPYACKCDTLYEPDNNGGCVETESGGDEGEEPEIVNPYVAVSSSTPMVSQSVVTDTDSDRDILIVSDTDTGALYANVAGEDGEYGTSATDACVISDASQANANVCDEDNTVTLNSGGMVAVYAVRSGGISLRFNNNEVQTLKLALEDGLLPKRIDWLSNFAKKQEYTLSGVYGSDKTTVYYDANGDRQISAAPADKQLYALFAPADTPSDSETACTESGGEWTNGACTCPGTHTLTDGKCVKKESGGDTPDTPTDINDAKFACYNSYGQWNDATSTCSCDHLPGALYNPGSKQCYCSNADGFVGNYPPTNKGCKCQTNMNPTKNSAGKWVCEFNGGTTCAPGKQMNQCHCDAVGAAVDHRIIINGTLWCAKSGTSDLWDLCTDGTVHGAWDFTNSKCICNGTGMTNASDHSCTCKSGYEPDFFGGCKASSGSSWSKTPDLGQDFKDRCDKSGGLWVGDSSGYCSCEHTRGGTEQNGICVCNPDQNFLDIMMGHRCSICKPGYEVSARGWECIVAASVRKERCEQSNGTWLESGSCRCEAQGSSLDENGYCQCDTSSGFIGGYPQNKTACTCQNPDYEPAAKDTSSYWCVDMGAKKRCQEEGKLWREDYDTNGNLTGKCVAYSLSVYCEDNSGNMKNADTCFIENSNEYNREYWIAESDACYSVGGNWKNLTTVVTSGTTLLGDSILQLCQCDINVDTYHKANKLLTNLRDNNGHCICADGWERICSDIDDNGKWQCSCQCPSGTEELIVNENGFGGETSCYTPDDAARYRKCRGTNGTWSLKELTCTCTMSGWHFNEATQECVYGTVTTCAPNTKIENCICESAYKTDEYCFDSETRQNYNNCTSTGGTWNDGTCTCPDTHTLTDGKCVKNGGDDAGTCAVNGRKTGDCECPENTREYPIDSVTYCFESNAHAYVSFGYEDTGYTWNFETDSFDCPEDSTTCRAFPGEETRCMVCECKEDFMLNRDTGKCVGSTEHQILCEQSGGVFEQGVPGHYSSNCYCSGITGRIVYSDGIKCINTNFAEWCITQNRADKYNEDLNMCTDWYDTPYWFEAYARDGKTAEQACVWAGGQFNAEPHIYMPTIIGTVLNMDTCICGGESHGTFFSYEKNMTRKYNHVTGRCECRPTYEMQTDKNDNMTGCGCPEGSIQYKATVVDGSHATYGFDYAYATLGSGYNYELKDGETVPVPVTRDWKIYETTSIWPNKYLLDDAGNRIDIDCVVYAADSKNDQDHGCQPNICVPETTAAQICVASGGEWISATDTCACDAADGYTAHESGMSCQCADG
ncbi:MAG: hypothetical protein IKL37_02305, partial [Alphaproteobacteria bacterium]|nr:hypothetical protein [Alphaproteobacteria bacterium]